MHRRCLWPLFSILRHNKGQRDYILAQTSAKLTLHFILWPILFLSFFLFFFWENFAIFSSCCEPPHAGWLLTLNYWVLPILLLSRSKAICYACITDTMMRSHCGDYQAFELKSSQRHLCRLCAKTVWTLNRKMPESLKRITTW